MNANSIPAQLIVLMMEKHIADLSDLIEKADPKNEEVDIALEDRYDDLYAAVHEMAKLLALVTAATTAHLEASIRMNEEGDREGAD